MTMAHAMLARCFNDDWMRERGFLNEENQVARDFNKRTQKTYRF